MVKESGAHGSVRDGYVKRRDENRLIKSWQIPVAWMLVYTSQARRNSRPFFLQENEKAQSVLAHNSLTIRLTVKLTAWSVLILDLIWFPSTIKYKIVDNNN